MPLYRCEQCNCVENTGLANYWQRKMDRQPLICSVCDPDIGTWHGHFPRRSAIGMHIDQSGHLWHTDTLKTLPKGYKILGIVEETGFSSITFDE